MLEIMHLKRERKPTFLRTLPPFQVSVIAEQIADF
jgi:hypothetical protein